VYVDLLVEEAVLLTTRMAMLFNKPLFVIEKVSGLQVMLIGKESTSQLVGVVAWQKFKYTLTLVVVDGT